MKHAAYLVVATLLLHSQALVAETEIPKVLSKYTEQGAMSFSAEQGGSDWRKEVGKDNRACSNCHGGDLKRDGKHVKTRKVIKAMALSANPDRYQKEKKIEKWFKRNCKWTWGRECTPQEKGNFLTYLSSL